MTRDVFISHASNDRGVAEQVCGILESRELSCWIAPRDVRPGQDWAEAIVEAIEKSKTMVLVFSEHANESAAVGGELEKAFATGIPVFPFRIRNVEPSKKIELFIRRVHWLDALTPPIEQQIHHLADAVHSVLGISNATEEADAAPYSGLTGEEIRKPDMAKKNAAQRLVLLVLMFLVLSACAVAMVVLLWPPRNESESRNLKTSVENSIGMQFALIPPGGFRMGSPENDDLAQETELPQHLVKISRPYYLGIFEVTQKQYADLTGKAPSYWSPEKVGRPTDNYPVTNVTWSDAVAFCRALSEQESRTYRLPTEAEWEYACRAGSSTRFPDGDEIEDLKRVAVVATEDINPGHPVEVGCLRPNAFGLYDILGNVREYCADCYGGYEPNLQVDPQGPDSGEYHVIRGGCYHFRWTDARCALRFPTEGRGAPNVGFRVLLETAVSDD